MAPPLPALHFPHFLTWQGPCSLQFPHAAPSHPSSYPSTRPQVDFKGLNPIFPSHYLVIAKKCFQAMKDNDFKVRLSSAIAKGEPALRGVRTKRD